MSAAVWLGVLLSLVGGILAGNCMLPMKYARKWAWENIWLAYSLAALVLLPWGMALAAVENLGEVYAAIPLSGYAAPFLFGFGWGIAQVLFGLSIARLGLALGYAIIIGLGALLGSLVPLFVQRREVLGTSSGALVLGGVAIMIVGIVVSGFAGRMRERAAVPNSPAPGTGGYGTALLVAVICGLMAPMLNYSFAFGQGIAEEAVRQGTPAARAGYAVWPVGLAGGLIPNVVYCWRLLSRNRTWSRFSEPRESWLAAAMGVMWMGAMAVYGVATVYLGALGTSAGWALFQIFMIMTANLSGMVTGEWRNAPGRASKLMWLGLALLALATVVISLGNR